MKTVSEIKAELEACNENNFCVRQLVPTPSGKTLEVVCRIYAHKSNADRPIHFHLETPHPQGGYPKCANVKAHKLDKPMVVNNVTYNYKYTGACTFIVSQAQVDIIDEMIEACKKAVEEFRKGFDFPAKKEEKEPFGWCDKCGSFCYGDCESNQ